MGFIWKKLLRKSLSFEGCLMSWDSDNIIMTPCQSAMDGNPKEFNDSVSDSK